MVDLEVMYDHVEIAEVLRMITRHYTYTGSPVAKRVIDQWPQLCAKFVKVMPRDYKRALARLQREEMETVKE